MEQRWIPVAERLPEESGSYLTWVRYDNEEFMSIEEIDCEGILKEWNFTGDVLYWMPLPEPYQVGAKNAHTKKSQTNADRIRSMTDDELAANMMCPNENGLAEIDCDKNDNCNCYECLLNWLRAESEG